MSVVKVTLFGRYHASRVTSHAGSLGPVRHPLILQIIYVAPVKAEGRCIGVNRKGHCTGERARRHSDGKLSQLGRASHTQRRNT